MSSLPAALLQCAHKNATSCRLSSIPSCCACADERQHTSTYRRYIDGIGFVQGGTRWQSYCPTCKEFWTNRIAAADPPIELSHTRIPETPDQTAFIERWNEFHQGYRIAKHADGTEQRIAVMGEPLKDVSPGLLPRTLAQMREGIINNATRLENRLQRRRLASEEQQPEEPEQSLEDMFDSLINEVLENEVPGAAEPPVLQIAELPANEPVEPPHPMTRREAQLQRAREQFVRIYGSREDIQQDDYESPLTTMYSRAYDRYRQAEQHRANGTTTAPPLDGLSPQERRDIEEQLLWGVMRESQAPSSSLEREGDVWSYTPARQPPEPSGAESSTSSGYAPDHSTDEEPYPPPLPPSRYPRNPAALDNSMRMLALEYRYQQRMPPPQSQPINAPHSSTPPLFPPTAAPSTAAPPNRPPIPTATHHFTAISPHAPILPPIQRPYTSMHPHTAISPNAPPLPAPQPVTSFTSVRTSIAAITNELQRLRLASEALGPTLPRRPEDDGDGPYISLDSQPERPASLSDAQMTRTLACQVCYQQLADIACLPCGHMVMCQWCADVVVPVRHTHIPTKPSKCPMCRKFVKQRFKIHMGS